MNAEAESLVSERSMVAVNAQLQDTDMMSKIDQALEQYQRTLSNQQWIFANELALGATPRQSMENAGYKSCSPSNAARVLDLHNCGVNMAYQLILKRRYLSEGISKRWCLAKLVAVTEEAHERSEYKTVIASIREINLMSGNHAPTNIKVDQAVSVSYEFIGLPESNVPGIREVMAEPMPKTQFTNIIEHQRLSAAGIEFSSHRVPKEFL